jgi:hypothetical protein
MDGKSGECDVGYTRRMYGLPRSLSHFTHPNCEHGNDETPVTSSRPVRRRARLHGHDFALPPSAPVKW